MSDLRGSRRFEAAPSSSPLMWGVGLVAVGMVVREAAVERHLELLVRGGDSQWGMVAWAGGILAVIGLCPVVVGVGYLASNVDYLAAREVERHRREVLAQEPRASRE